MILGNNAVLESDKNYEYIYWMNISREYPLFTSKIENVQGRVTLSYSVNAWREANRVFYSVPDLTFDA